MIWHDLTTLWLSDYGELFEAGGRKFTFRKLGFSRLNCDPLPHYAGLQSERE
jgi:hypothetical protein